MISSTILSQTFIVTGSVTDSLTGEPIQSANVIVQSFDHGTSTDIKGKLLSTNLKGII